MKREKDEGETGVLRFRSCTRSVSRHKQEEREKEKRGDYRHRERVCVCTCIREKKRKEKESIKRRFPTIGGWDRQQQRRRPGLYPSSFSTPDDMMKEKLNAVRCLVVINKHKENKKQQHSTRGVKRKLSWLYNTDKRRWGGLQGLLFVFWFAQRERERNNTQTIFDSTMALCIKVWGCYHCTNNHHATAISK